MLLLIPTRVCLLLFCRRACWHSIPRLVPSRCCNEVVLHVLPVTHSMLYPVPGFILQPQGSGGGLRALPHPVWGDEVRCSGSRSAAHTLYIHPYIHTIDTPIMRPPHFNPAVQASQIRPVFRGSSGQERLRQLFPRWRQAVCRGEPPSVRYALE